jgi:hypothetical protein
VTHGRLLTLNDVIELDEIIAFDCTNAVNGLCGVTNTFRNVESVYFKE